MSTFSAPESQSFSQPVPLRALLLSVLAFSAPLLGMTVAPEWTTGDQGMLLWLTALLPPFLLTYYRGWGGASIGLAAGMAALVMTDLGMIVLQASAPSDIFVLWVTATYIAVCVGAGFLGDLLRRERRAAEERALIDGLTGLPNRRHAGVFLEAAFSGAVRGQPVSVAVFRLDQLDQIVERFGPRTGEQVMRRFGAILTELTRRMDLSARWQGDRFVSILARCKAGGAASFTTRVQEEVRADVFPWGKVTVSAGVAEFEVGMGSPELLLAAADQALSAAQRDGGDRYMIAGTRAESFLERQPPSHPSAQRGGLRLENRRGGFQLVPAPKGEGGSGPKEDTEGSASRQLPKGSEKILVISEDIAERTRTVASLKPLGYKVAQASGWEAALERIGKAGIPDLLVADLIMHETCGFSLVAQVENDVGPVRAVYLAGSIQDEISWRGAPGHRVGFVGKPVQNTELAVTVREVLDLPIESHESPRELVGSS